MAVAAPDAFGEVPTVPRVEANRRVFGEIPASRTKGGEIRSKSLLGDFSISEIRIGRQQSTANEGRAVANEQKANDERQKAEQARDQATTNEAKALYNQAAALTALADGAQKSSPTRAVKLALAAWPRSPDDNSPRLSVTIAALIVGILQDPHLLGE